MSLHRRMLASATATARPDDVHHRRPVRRVAVAVMATSMVLGAPVSAGATATTSTIRASVAVTATTISSEIDVSDGFGVRTLTVDVSDRGGRPVLVELDGAPEFLVIDRAGFGGEVELSLRARTADGWSPLVEVHDEGTDAPDGVAGEEGDGGAVATPPIWLGRDAEAVELHLEGVAPATLRLETLDDLVGPVETTPSNLPRAALTSGQPAINGRATWTSEDFAFGNDGCEDGPAVADDLRVAVVHHTVTTNSYAAADVPAQIRAIRRTHVDINGWCDIGYNFVVDRYGGIWEARTGGLEQPIIGAHTRGFNTGAVGVAMLGSFQSGAGSPTSAMTDAAAALIGWKLALHGVDPKGLSELQNRASGPGMKFAELQFIRSNPILGHLDLGHTACPGSNGYNVVSAIRSRVAAQADLVAPYDFPGFVPAEFGPAVWLVDIDGGIRSAGAAPVESTILAPGIVAAAGAGTGAAALTEDGRIVGLGSLTSAGWHNASVGAGVDVALASDGSGGWIARADGSVDGFGSVSSPSIDRASNAAAVAIVRLADGRGSLVHADGAVSALAGGPSGSAGGPAVDAAPHPEGGVVVLRTDGSVAGVAGAPSWGASPRIGRPVAVMVAPDGDGGWVADAEGRVEGVGDQVPVSPISTHVGTERVTDAAFLGSWLGPNDAPGETARWARLARSTFLDAATGDVELTQLLERVERERSSTVIEEMVESDIWAGSMVDDLYQRSLGRAPDAAGRAYWIDQLAGDLVFANAGVYFFGSDEYALAGGDNEGFVRNLYRDLLGRTPDAAGLDYWVGQMNAGRAGPPDVAAGFYVSPESRGIRVDEVYRSLFGRSPDATTRAELAEDLNEIDDMDLAVALALSDEFRALANN